VKLYYVATDKACGGVTVSGNKIVDTPPIWKGWREQSWSRFKAYYKPTTVEEIGSWLKDVWGKWPGDEPIEALLKGLEETDDKGSDSENDAAATPKPV